AACPHCARAQAPGGESMLIVELEKQMPPPTGSESEIDLEKFRLNRLPVESGPPSGSAVNLGLRGPATVEAAPSPSDSNIDIARPAIAAADSSSHVGLGEVNSESGASVVKRGSEEDDSSVDWVSLEQDVSGSGARSGVNIDPQSAESLLAKAAAEQESVSDVITDPPGQSAAAEDSSVRIGASAEARPEIGPDSGSRLGIRMPPMPVFPGASGVIVRGGFGADQSADSATFVGGSLPPSPIPVETSGI